ncbi:hypothetical protein CR513_43560, partial [Mucuna pruriens]
MDLVVWVLSRLGEFYTPKAERRRGRYLVQFLGPKTTTSNASSAWEDGMVDSDSSIIESSSISDSITSSECFLDEEGDL